MSKKQSRRQFLRKAAYTAPAVMTMKAAPSFASTGSQDPTAADSPQAASQPSTSGVLQPSEKLTTIIKNYSVK